MQINGHNNAHISLYIYMHENVQPSLSIICLRNLFRHRTPIDPYQQWLYTYIYIYKFQAQVLLGKMTQLLFPGIKASGSLLQHRIPSRQTTNRTRYQTQKSYNRLTKKKLEFCQVRQPTLSIFNFFWIFSEGFWVWEVKTPPQTATPPASHPKPWGAPRSGDEDAWCRGIDCMSNVYIWIIKRYDTWKTTTTNRTRDMCCFKTHFFTCMMSTCMHVFYVFNHFQKPDGFPDQTENNNYGMIF